MSAPSIDNETTLSFAGTAEQHVSVSRWFSTIIVANETTVPVSVAVDGGTATATGSNETEVAGGQTVEFDNEQGLPNWNTVPNKDRSEDVGTTAQSGYSGTNATFCSVCPTATVTGTVTVTFQ